MEPETRGSALSLGLAGTFVASALLLASCSRPSADITTNDALAISTAGATSTTDPIGTSPLVVEDISPVDPVDPQSSASIAELYGASESSQPSIDAGDWYTDSFSTPLAFRLPAAGELAGQGKGWLQIKITTANGSAGFISLVEAVALNSPEGPIPIGTIGSESEFSDTTLIDRGIVIANDQELSWRDLIIESSSVPTQFQSPCPNSNKVCTDALVTEGGPILTELDTVHRFVGQDYGRYRLFVIATRLDPDDQGLTEMALEVAASVVMTDRTEQGTRRPITDIGLRADAIPSGEWFAALDGATVEFHVDTAISGYTLFDVSTTSVALASASRESEFEQFFAVQVFQGFPNGVELDGLASDAPLSAAEFFKGLEQIIEITQTGPASIGRLDAVLYRPRCRRILRLRAVRRNEAASTQMSPASSGPATGGGTWRGTAATTSNRSA